MVVVMNRFVMFACEVPDCGLRNECRSEHSAATKEVSEFGGWASVPWERETPGSSE